MQKKGYRKESDFIGEVFIPEEALYGINAYRALHNFPAEGKFKMQWYKAAGTVKKAVYLACQKYSDALKSHSPDMQREIRRIDPKIFSLLIESAEEVAQGKHFEHFIVPAVQGGAGTAANMNINEIIANRSLNKIGKKAGDYEIISPFDHANIFQSTNDLMPTALTTASMQLLEELEEEINKLRFETEALERKYRNSLRIAYTQLQQAVPSSFGKLFGTYNDAFSRDWWRISKCFERIKVINLGGSAVGTSVGVPRYIVREAPRILQKITKLPLTGSENLSDTTANLDGYVEVHGILKAHAVNLEKMVSDLRLAASDFCGNAEIKLRAQQTGSSIMPGKINPVIPEFVISACRKIYANDGLIASLAASGNFELNPFLPQVGDALIESLKLLIAADRSIRKNMIDGLEINTDIAEKKLFRSPAVTTALTVYIGYADSTKVAALMQKENIDVFEANKRLNLFPEESLKNILSPDKLLKNGYSVKDIIFADS